MFGGVAFNNFGGVRSRGPPWGNCRLAHPKKNKAPVKTGKNIAKKGRILLDIVFKRYKRFFYFNER